MTLKSLLSIGNNFLMIEEAHALLRHGGAGFGGEFPLATLHII